MTPSFPSENISSDGYPEYTQTNEQGNLKITNVPDKTINFLRVDYARQLSPVKFRVDCDANELYDRFLYHLEEYDKEDKQIFDSLFEELEVPEHFTTEENKNENELKDLEYPHGRNYNFIADIQNNNQITKANNDDAINHWHPELNLNASYEKDFVTLSPDQQEMLSVISFVNKNKASNEIKKVCDKFRQIASMQRRNGLTVAMLQVQQSQKYDELRKQLDRFSSPGEQ